jgi:hypothetical protein
MAFSRYTRDYYNATSTGLANAAGILAVRKAVKYGAIPISRTIVTTQADRLDTIAGELYGDGRYWWILAAASDIGWGLQVPPNTIINVLDLKDVERLVG